jgi:hypothetical protein
MAFDGSDAVHDRVDVKELASGNVRDGGWRYEMVDISEVDCGVFS